MRHRFSLVLLLGALTLATFPLTGCGGTECGPGTTDSDGECVAKGQKVTDEVCGEGTVLADGACVIDDSACSGDTQLNPDTGLCEQVPGFCGEGTTWDATAEECMPNSDITCGANTTKQDGSCVVDAEACAEGEVLDTAAGECVSTDTYCSGSTSFDPNSGACVISSDACATGEVLDTAAGECVAIDTYCTDSTTFDPESGACVPSLDEVCGPKTTADDNGQCIIQADACADGEVLDPNSGDCVATDTYCSSTTAFDADSGTCVPTDAVCDTGTVFDTDTGLCLPSVTCAAGDVILNGHCVRPVEQAAANADVTETENNDPSLGGTAQSLTLPATGMSTVFTGTIGAPSDLNGDSSMDQDRDSFTFDATAGQWIQVTVQSNGLPAPAFTIEGPDGYSRQSAIGLSANPTRQIAIPRDGAYTVTVLPGLVMQSDGSVGPIGGADWSWVGTLEQLAAPTAADVDLTSTTMTGTYDTLSDNWFNLTGVAGGDVLTLTADVSGANAEGIVQIWSSPTQLEGQFDIDSGDSVDFVVPASGTAMVLVDWSEINGPALDFDLSGTAPTNFENVGVLTDDTTNMSTAAAVMGGDSYKYSFSVNAGQVIELVFDDTEEEEVEFSLKSSSGAELASDTYIDVISDSYDTDYTYWYSANGGTYLLEVTPNDSSQDLTGLVAHINTMTPNDLGSVSDGAVVHPSSTTALDEGRSRFYKFTTSATLLASGEIVTPADEDVDIEIWNASSVEVASESSYGSAVSFSDLFIPSAGDFLLRVDADDDLPSYTGNMSFVMGPLGETEPNDTPANANAYDTTRTLRGTTDDTGQVDVYSFNISSDLAADEVFIADLISLDSGTDRYKCTLTDSSAAVVGASSTGSDGDEDGCLTMSTGLLASETYYLTIERTYGSDLDHYSFTMRTETGTLEVEPNESQTASTSFDLATLIGGGDLFGRLPDDADTDYFSFTLSSARPSGEILAFTSQRLGANPVSLDWKLIDGSGNELDSGGINTDLSVTSLSAGTYYIEFSRSSSSTEDSGIYQISANATVPVCGNGTLETGEACDDGNTSAGDTCAADCLSGMSPTNHASAAIDSSHASFDKLATVSGCSGTVTDVSVDVDITHEYRGDLILKLVSPDGTSVTLHDQSFDSAHDIVGNYPGTLTVEGPGSLSDYTGEAGNGDWKLSIEDDFPSSDDGTFNSFTVNVMCN